MVVGPGYCPVWWHGKEYQINYSPFDLILRQGKFSQFVQSVTVWMWWDFWGWTWWENVRVYICFRVPAQVQSIQDTILTGKKKLKNPFLRKPSSNGICLDLGKLTTEDRTGFNHNRSQDFISEIVWQMGMHFTSWTWEILCGSMALETWWLYLALRSLCW